MRPTIVLGYLLCFLTQAVFASGMAPSPTEVLVTPASFAQACAAARPGCELLLQDGTYRDVHLLLGTRGEAAKPITLRARHPGKAVLTGKSQLTISGQHLVVSGLVFDQAWGDKVVEFSAARHCRLTDCAFIECGDPASTFSHVIYLVRGSAHNRVDHCIVQGSLSMSMGVKAAPDDFANIHNTFDHNYFRDIAPRSDNGQEAVQVGQGKFSSSQTMHARVEYCLFERASGDPEIISNKSCGNTYCYNTFRDCNAALTLRSGGSVLVQGNVFQNCLAGVRVHASHSAIVGNVMEGCANGLELDLGHGPDLDVDGHMTAHHNLIANNLIRDCKAVAVRIGHHHGGGRASAWQVPFANLLVNNVVLGDQGELLKFEAPNDSRWLATSLWPRDAAKSGARPTGVTVERVELASPNGIPVLPASRARRIREYEAEILPVLSAMPVPRLFDEVFPEAMKVRALAPDEVGPTWMKGQPARLPRIANPKPVPPLPGAPAPRS